MAKKNPSRKNNAVLPGNEKSKVATTIRIMDIADLIVKKGYGRMECIRFVQEQWGLSEKQAERYYYGALNYLKPEDAEGYREALINRNFSVMEELLQRAMESGDTKTALDVVKAMNTLLGVGGKQVEISDKGKEGEEKKIVISFSD